MSVLLTPTDLGPCFNTSAPGPVDIRIDGVTVQKNGSDELVSPVTSMSYNALTATLSYVDEAGNTTDIDLAALAADIFVSGGSFSAATSVLTLTDNDAGTPDITIDLSQLLGVSTDAGNLLSNGTDNKAFLNATDICDAVKANCVVNPGTPCTDLAGNVLGYLVAP